MSDTIQIGVTGMTCGGCENAVVRVLTQTPGVERASASHREARVDVVYEPTTVSPDVLRRRITELGYTVQP